MNTNSPIYTGLNKAWKSTCKIIFGEEIGELREYEEWLKEYLPAIGKRKSYISGKDVTLTVGDYCKTANFVSLDEVKEKSIEPLTINEIKDIDSIIEAISGKWEYVGNKILGNSAFVGGADSVKDSQYVLDSASIEKSSYIYSSFHCTNSRYVFGGVRIADGEFIICGLRGFGKRCFDYYWCLDNGDLYVCAGCGGCSELMFCFNQRNKNYRIGNLQLTKEKYLSLKSKLVSEICEEIKRNKRFPSIFELVPNENPKQQAIEIINNAPKRKEGDLRPIDNAFRSTFKVLLKKEVEGMGQYEEWLYRSVPKVREIVTATGSKTYTLRPEFYKIFSKIPEKRMLGFEESNLLDNLHLNEVDIVSIKKIKEKLSEIAYISDEYFSGKYDNLIQCGGGTGLFHIYKSAAKDSEYVGLSDFPVDSKYIFGCDRAINSQFCIKCHYILDSMRCFEVDSCEKCSDTYFSHNCEGLSDSMFCFNTKAKRYAIGNSQLPPDKYRKIKDILIEQMADEILKKKELRYDIFNVGCGRI